jgi:hypothetical protein
MYPEQVIPTDPSLPPAADMAVWYPSYYCDCRWPIREERAERHGAARTYCARCDRELPLKLGLGSA